VIDVDMPFEDLGAILAANVFHRAAVLGPPVPGARSLSGLRGRLSRGGGEEVTIDVAESALDPLEVVRLVAGYLEARGDSLRPDDVIIAGSLIRAVPLEGDEQVALEVEGLGSVSLELRSA
jgi:2-keto-4-pentenoate hydratase